MRSDGLPRDDEPILQQARALMEAGRLREGLEEYHRLIACTQDGLHQAVIALDAGTRLSWYGWADEAILYLEQALATCEDRRSPVHVVVQLQLGACLLWTERAEEGARRISAAVPLAERFDDPVLKSLAALAEADLLSHNGMAESAALRYEVGAQLALKVTDPQLAVCGRRLAARGFHRASTHWFQLGRLTKALDFSGCALEQAECAHDCPQLMKVRSFRCLLYWMMGEWRHVRPELTAVRNVRTLLHHPPNEAFYSTTVDSALAGWVGDDDSLERALAELADAEFPHPLFEPGRWILQTKGKVLQGQYDEAKSILGFKANTVPMHPPSGQFDAWAMAAFHVLSCFCDVGDAESALLWYQRLEPYGDLLIPLGWPALELGRAASLYERWREALYWLTRARDMAVREGAKPFEAIIIYELGLLHLRRNRGDDLSQAQGYFRQAAEKFVELGMHRHRQWAQQQLDQMKTPRGRGILSPRMKDALLLHEVAGRSREETAERMGISIKTVDRHLSNGRNKLSELEKDTKAKRIDWLNRNGTLEEDE